MPPKRKPKNKRRGKKNEGSKMILSYRGPNGMPPRFRTTLRFNKPSLFVVNAGFINSSIQFEPTFAYDVDPTLGSTAMPFFSELQSVYRKYRVNSFQARATVANSDTTGGTAWLCPGNFNIPANTGTYQNYLSNRLSHKMEVGAVAGNAKATLSKKVSQSMYTGIARTMSDDNTCGSGVITPVNNIYIGLGMLTGANQVAGLLVEIDINIDIDFYELGSPTALTPSPSAPVDLFRLRQFIDDKKGTSVNVYTHPTDQKKNRDVYFRADELKQAVAFRAQLAKEREVQKLVMNSSVDEVPDPSGI